MTQQSGPPGGYAQSTLTELVAFQAPFTPDGAHVTTVAIEAPPAMPAPAPPRHSGPVAGYVLEGELIFELEGAPERVMRASEAFRSRAEM